MFLASIGAISWQSRKQSLITMPTLKAKFIACSETYSTTPMDIDENVADILTKAIGL